MAKSFPSFLSIPITGIFFLLASMLMKGVEGTIGVNYGTMGSNLPPPSQVAHFLQDSTIINRVRLFDADSSMLQAFAHTDIAITVTVPNDQIPQLNNLSFAQQWLENYIQPYLPATNIVRILVGNEVLSTANKLLITGLVPAMQTLHIALVEASLDRRIQISTPHSLGILLVSSPPSAGRFRPGYDTHILRPLLSFLRYTNSPFMVNPYPFFGTTADTLDYALFRPNSGMFDENTSLLYTNMLDAQLDSVFSAMKLLGFDDLEIVVAETGWPSLGDSDQIGVDVNSAAEYNGNLIRHVRSGAGTPLMPNRTFETYIFALFNEDLKPGPTYERNFGLFLPNMTPVYDIGILQSTVAVAASPNHGHVTCLLDRPFPINPAPKPETVGNSGAFRKRERTKVLCKGLLITCVGWVWTVRGSPIQEGGACFFQNTVRAHAAYAMSAYNNPPENTSMIVILSKQQPSQAVAQVMGGASTNTGYEGRRKVGVDHGNRFYAIFNFDFLFLLF